MPPTTKRRRTTSNNTPLTLTSSTPASTFTSTRSKSKASSTAQSTLSFRSSKASATRNEAAKKAEKKEEEIEHAESPRVATADVVNIDVDEVDVNKPVTPQVPALDINDPALRILQYAEPLTQEETVAESEDIDETALEQAVVEKQALALPEARIKSYWAEKETERKAPRVHQQGLTVREKVLREFDMGSRFGPSIGIPRIARWRRAHALGMDPPIEVLAVLLKEEQTKGPGGAAQRSIMEDLIMSSRVRGDNIAEP